MNNIFSISIVPSIWFYVIASIPIIMEPTKNMPSYHLLLLFKKIIDNKKNSENYQLYHEIMNEFHTKGKNLDNLYHLIYSLRPYFKQIRPTLENMLPLLRDYKYEEAWALFSNEIGTKEAKNLALLMQEVENTSVENAIKKLELRKSEFANSLYESLKDYLAIKHAVIYAIVLVGGFFVVINPFVAFWLWHRLTMNEINNFQILIGG
ncbi:hypothetical protein [Anaerobacillus arseniciselenatis]|nr:hypothetical protein [Anaerobacillus arseniciselenatis]